MRVRRFVETEKKLFPGRRFRHVAKAIVTLPLLAPIAAGAQFDLTPAGDTFDEGDPDITLSVGHEGSYNTGSVNASFTVDYDGSTPLFSNSNFPLTHTLAIPQDTNGSASNWSVSGSYDYESQSFSIGGSGSFTIRNVAPTITSATFDDGGGAIDNDITVPEGTVLSLQMSSTDPGADTHSFTINGQGAGTDFNTTATRFSQLVSFTAENDTSSPIIIDFTVEDDHPEDAATLSRTVTITNVAPTIQTATFNDGTGAVDDNITVPEGTVLSLGMSATDPGTDTHQFTINGQDAGTDNATSGTRSSQTPVSFTAANDLGGPVSLDFQAFDGTDTSTQSRTVTITNVAPTIQSATLNDGTGAVNDNITVPEGTVLSLAMSATDPGTDTHQFTIDGQDAGTDSATSGVRSSQTPVSFTAANDLGGPVSLDFKAFDGTDTSTQSRTVTITNVAPTIQSATLNDGSGAVNDNITVPEGTVLSLAMSATDPGTDTHQFTIDGQDAGTDNATTGTRSSQTPISFTAANDLSGPVSLDFKAFDGTDTSTQSRTVTITNVAPTIQSATLNDGTGAVNDNITVPEGTILSLAMSATDPGTDTHQFTIDGQDAGTDSATSGTRSSQTPVSFTAANDLSGPVSLDFKAFDGTDTSTQSRTVTITNVAPTITSATLNDGNGAVNDNITVPEGTVLSLAMSATDPGTDTHQFTIDGQNAGTDSATSGTRSSQAPVSFTAANDLGGPVSLDFQAFDGTDTSTQSRTVTITNVAPTIQSATLDDGTGAVNGNITVPEGTVLSLAMSATDPGTDTHQFTINGQDAGTDSITSGTRNSQTPLSFTAVNDNASPFGVDFQAFDGTDTATLTRQVTVTNVAPTLDSGSTTGNSVLDFGVSPLFSFQALATDPGVLDVLTYNWDLNGDGIYDDFAGISGLFDYSSFPGLFSGELLQLGVQVGDGDGGFDTRSFTLEFQNVPTPEPSSLALATCAVTGFTAMSRRRKKT